MPVIFYYFYYMCNITLAHSKCPNCTHLHQYSCNLQKIFTNYPPSGKKNNGNKNNNKNIFNKN